MLTSLRRWWTSRRRLLFSFHDGRGTRWADPLVIARTLDDLSKEEWSDWSRRLLQLQKPVPDLPENIQAIRRKERDDLVGKLVGLTRKVFRLPELSEDGSGLTEYEVIGVLSDYMSYMGGLAELARPLPSSSGLSEGSPADSTMKPSVDSTGTSTPSDGFEPKNSALSS